MPKEITLHTFDGLTLASTKDEIYLRVSDNIELAIHKTLNSVSIRSTIGNKISLRDHKVFFHDIPSK